MGKTANLEFRETKNFTASDATKFYVYPAFPYYDSIIKTQRQASLFRKVTVYCQSHQFAKSLFIFKGINSLNQRLFAKVTIGQVTVYLQSHILRVKIDFVNFEICKGGRPQVKGLKKTDRASDRASDREKFFG